MRFSLSGVLSPWTQRIKPETIILQNINSASCRKRMFCVIDRDKPYALDIEYKQRAANYTISFRYEDRDLCERDCLTIKNLLEIYCP